MACEITSELQKEIISYIAQYIKSNPSASVNEIITGSMKRLIDEIRKQVEANGESLKLRHINAISTIPLIISNNFLAKTKNCSKKVADICDKFISEKDVVNDWAYKMEGSNWIDVLDDNFNLKEFGSFTEKQSEAMNRLVMIKAYMKDVPSVKDFPSQKILYITKGGKAIKKTAEQKNGVLFIEGMQSDASKMKETTKIDEIENKFLYFTQKSKLKEGNIYRIVITEPNADDPRIIYDNDELDKTLNDNSVSSNKNAGFKVYVNIIDGAEKIGVIRHFDDNGNKIPENILTNLERKIITAYKNSNGELYVEYKNGKLVPVKQDFVYNSYAESVKVVSTTAYVPVSKMNDTYRMVFGETQFMTVATALMGDMFYSGFTSRVKNNPELNSVFMDNFNSNTMQVKVGGKNQELFLKIDVGEPAFEIRTLTDPFLVFKVCDQFGNVLKFKNENGKLEFSESGEEIIFPFMAYFISTIGKINKEKTKDLLVKHGMTNEEAEKYSSIIDRILYDMRSRALEPDATKKVYKITRVLSKVVEKLDDTNPVLPVKNQSQQQLRFDKNLHCYTLNGKPIFCQYDEEYAEKLGELIYGKTNSVTNKDGVDIDRFAILQELFYYGFNIVKDGVRRHFEFKNVNGQRMLVEEKKVENGFDDIPIIQYNKDGNVLVADNETVELFKEEIKKSNVNYGSHISITPFFKDNKTMYDIDGNKKSLFEFDVFFVRNSVKVNDPMFFLEENKTATQNNEETKELEKKDVTPNVINENNLKLGGDNANLFDDIELNKNIIVKNSNLKANEEQIREAKEWYENSPLAKVIPFQEMYDVVNSTSIANWTTYGITLFQGSDYTDLYHESWHGFSQLFLTKQQKIDLYNSVKRKKGSFKDYNGNDVKFSDANYKQIEEYLAEQFREYMLTDQTKQHGIIYRFFKKIKDILVHFFTGKYTSEQLFNKLKNGDISEFTADKSNIYFSKLKKTIEIKNGETTEFLSTKKTNRIDALMDIYFAQFLPLFNTMVRSGVPISNLMIIDQAYSRMLEYTKDNQFSNEKFEEILSEIINEKYKEKYSEEELKGMVESIKKLNSAVILTSKEKRYTSTDLTSFLSNEKSLKAAYVYSRTRLKMNLLKHKSQIEALDKKIKYETDKDLKEQYSIQIDRLKSQMQTIQTALDNYGDVGLLDQNKTGVVVYHYKNNFSDIEVIDAKSEDDEDEFNNSLRDYADNKVNDQSADDRIKDDKTLKFILSSLPMYTSEIDEDSNYTYKRKMNDYLEYETMPYSEVKNMLIKILENSRDEQDMYERLKKLAYKTELKYENGKPVYVQSDNNPVIAALLEYMGDPNNISSTDFKTSLTKNNLWISLYNGFGVPQTRLHETDITKREVIEEDESSVESELDAILGSSDSNQDVKTRTEIEISVDEQNGPIWKMDDYYRTNARDNMMSEPSHEGLVMSFQKIIDFVDGVRQRARNGGKTLEKDNDLYNSDYWTDNDLFGLLYALGLSVTVNQDNIYELRDILFAKGENKYFSLNDFGSSYITNIERIINKVKNLQSDGKVVSDPIKEFWKSGDEPYLGRTYRWIKEQDMKYNTKINGEMVRNAEGKTLFMNQKHNSITLLMSDLNNAKNYKEVLENSSTCHLDVRKYVANGEVHGKEKLPVYEYNEKYNPVCAASKWLPKLFDMKISYVRAYVFNKRTGKYKLVDNLPVYNIDAANRTMKYKLRLVNLSGIKTKVFSLKGKSESGQSLFEADRKTTAITYLITVSQAEQETLRHADNGVSYSISISNADEIEPELKFGESDIYRERTPDGELGDYNLPAEAYSRIKEGIIKEIERILTIMELRKRAEEDNNFAYDRNYLYKKDVLKLGIYDDMLSASTKDEINKLIEKSDYTTLINLSESLQQNIKADLKSYFTKTIEENKEIFNSSLDIITDNSTKESLIIKLFSMYKEKYGLRPEQFGLSEDGFDGLDAKEKLDLITYVFTFNYELTNLELVKNIYGDVMLFNLTKDEFTKRIKGMGSSGSTASDSIATRELLKMASETSFLKSRNSNAEDKFLNQEDGCIRTAVCSDLFPVSAYSKAYKDVSKSYESVEEESNGQAFMAFDAYRYMSIRLNKWSIEKENLFQKICSGEEINPKDVIKFFPVLKLQFNGPILTGYMPEFAFHKYSIMPIIPNVFKDTNIEKVHERMMKEGIHYITFNSGSKEFNVSRDLDSDMREKSVYDKQYGDKLYEPESLDIKNRIKLEDGKIVVKPRVLNKRIESEEQFFTPNVMPIRYYKDQVEIHDELDADATFATQMRRLMINNFFSGGYPVDITKEQRDAFDNANEKEREKMSPVYKLTKTYTKLVSKLTQNNIKNIRKQFGISGMNKLDEAKLFDFAKKQLQKQNVPQYAIDQLKSLQDLQFSPYAKDMEKAMMSLINRNVIKQKIHGGQFVQVASTLLERLDNAAIATNDLQFYGEGFTKQDLLDLNFSEEQVTEYLKDQINVVKPGEGIEPATIKIPLAGDFLNLLNAKDLDGNVIGTIEDLNKCLKNNEWVNKNIDAISIVSCRIPVQGYNSIESFRVAEFLNPGCNNIIVCPSEQVIKSGSDYDVDKLTTVTPHIKIVNDNAYVPFNDNDALTEQEQEDYKKFIEERNKGFKNIVGELVKKLGNIIKHETDESKVIKAQEILEKVNVYVDQLDSIKRAEESVKSNYNVEKVDDTYNEDLQQKKTELYKNILNVIDEAVDAFDMKNAEQKNKNEGVSFKILYEKIQKYKSNAQNAELLLNEKISKKRYNQSKAGIENSLLVSMRNILKHELIWKSLLTPNSTDLFRSKNPDDDLPANNLEKNVSYNRNHSKMSNETKEMSPTRVIEFGYNLDKHDNFNTGKSTLSIGAVDNVAHPIFKQTGTKLSEWNMEEKEMSVDDVVIVTKEDMRKMKLDQKQKEKIIAKATGIVESNGLKKNKAAQLILVKLNKFKKQKLLLKHNQTDGKIDLSMSFDADNKIDISDVHSQIINGCVDVAKDAWITTIQFNNEAAGTIDFMIQAGIPKDDIIYFVSNPEVIKYLKKKSELNSSLNALNETKYMSNENYARAFMIGISMKTRRGKYKNKVSLTGEIESKINFTLSDVKKFDSARLKNIALGKEKEDSNYNKKVLAHFFEIEDMAKAPNELKLAIRVDGAKSNSFYEVRSRQEGLKKIEQNEQLDKESFNKIRYNSILSSFFVGDEISAITDLTLPLKSNKYLLKRYDSFELTSDYDGELTDLFDNYFSSFLSFLYQYKMKSTEEELSDTAKPWLEQVNAITDLAGLTDNEKTAIAIQASTLDKEFKKDEKKSFAFKQWYKNYVALNEDADFEKVEIQEGLYNKFIVLNASHSLGFNTLVKNKDLNIASKFELVKNVITRYKGLRSFFANYNILDRITWETLNNGSRELITSYELTDEEKGEIYEDYMDLIDNGKLKSALDKISSMTSFDKKIVLDFFTELPYMTLASSSNRRISLGKIFNHTNVFKAEFQKFDKLDEDSKDKIMSLFEDQFTNNNYGRTNMYGPSDQVESSVEQNIYDDEYFDPSTINPDDWVAEVNNEPTKDEIDELSDIDDKKADEEINKCETKAKK